MKNSNVKSVNFKSSSVSRDQMMEFVDSVFQSTIEERDKKLMKYIDNLDNYIRTKYPKKKTIKEYLLSPLSNLWSTLARPWTSKG